MNNQFIIGENNLHKRNNINLISKENNQFKENIINGNSINNLFEISKNKNDSKTDLKLNQNIFKNEFSSKFFELLNKIIFILRHFKTMK